MGQKNTVTLICDRCGAETSDFMRGWSSIGTPSKPLLLCHACTNAFTKFLRGGAVKAVKA
jgi:hypothetical protein